MRLFWAEMMDNSLTAGGTGQTGPDQPGPDQPGPGQPGLPPGRRIYVVGDVHGHRDRLAAVHAAIRADLAGRPVAAPMLVHLGDLIDRGPDSAGCLALLASGPPIPGVPTVNLMGNHERMMLDAVNGGGHEETDRWLDNGGDKTLASWGLKSSMKPSQWLAGIPARHLVLLNGLKLYWEQDGYFFVHAGVRPGTPRNEQRETDLLWIRDSFLGWNGVMLPDVPHRVIVHGHTPMPDPVVKANRIGLDTGAGKGGPLTCAVLEGRGLGLFQR